MQNCEDSEGVLATTRSGEGNMGTRGHDGVIYHFLFKVEGTLFK